jgi:GAF domain-containing protein
MSDDQVRMPWFDMLLETQTDPDEQLDILIKEVAAIFNVPIAMVNLVGSEYILFKACIGRVQGTKLDRDGAFCSLAIKQEAPYVMSDTRISHQFKNSPLVIGPPYVQSYAGKSLHAPGGSPIGTLCLLDIKPRVYSKRELGILTSLAEQADQLLVAMFGKSVIENLSTAAA